MKSIKRPHLKFRIDHWCTPHSWDCFFFSQRNRHYNAIKQVFYILIFFCSSIYEKMIATIRQMKKWIENLIKYKNLVSVRCNCRHAQRVHFYQYSIVCGEYSFFHREIYIFGISLLTLNQNQRISHGIRYAINERKNCLKLIEIQIYKNL